MAERMITISTDEYSELIRSQEALEMLVDMLYNSAELSYNKEDLHFQNVESIMKAYCRARYNITYQTLKGKTTEGEGERMNTQKNEPPHGNGSTAQADGHTSASIIPKNSTKIKDEFIRYLREKGIQSKDMVSVVSGTYAKYDKYLQSKVENGESYGVELRNDAIDALVAAFAPEKAAEVKRKRGGGHKLQKTIFARLPDKMYYQLHDTIKAKGFSSVQSWLTYIVVLYLQKEAAR